MSWACALVLTVWLARRWQKKESSGEKCSRDFVIVKLGGSAITFKSQLETLNHEALLACAKHLAEVKGVHLVVIHGAGSFGHFQAKEYALSTGTSHPRWQFGFVDTRRAVTHLHREVVASLVRVGVLAVGLSPLSGCRTHGKAQLTQADTITQAIELASEGFVPVLHGDCVKDTRQGCSILSGDVLLVKLCQLLRPRLRAVVFVTDVPGVLTHPPSDPRAELIPMLTLKDGKIDCPAVTTLAHDVTGGLSTKLASAASVAQLGCPVDIVQAGSPGALAALTQTFGSPIVWRGTRICELS